MKIAVLDFRSASLDIIKVDEEWLQSDLRNALPEWYDDDEWAQFDESDLIQLFLYEYCNYSASNIEYMADLTEVNKLTPNDFN